MDILLIAKWIVFLLILVIYAKVIVERWKKIRQNGSELPWGKPRWPFFLGQILLLILSPGLFPLPFFIMAYMGGLAAFMPTLVVWGFSWNLLFLTIMAIIVSLIANYGTGYLFPNDWISAIPEEQRKQIGRMDSSNRKISAAMTAFTVAFNAGLGEELSFRFEFLMAVQPLIALLVFLLNLNLSWIAGLFPVWLSLGITTTFSPLLLAAAVITNLIFAAIHIYDEKGINPKFSLRVIYAWFAGWVLMLAVIQVGILGAMVIHFLIDFLALLPLLFTRFDKLAEIHAAENHGFYRL